MSNMSFTVLTRYHRVIILVLVSRYVHIYTYVHARVRVFFCGQCVCVCLRDILLCKGGWLRSTSFEFIVKKDMYPPFGLRGGKEVTGTTHDRVLSFLKGGKIQSWGFSLHSVCCRTPSRTDVLLETCALETFLNFFKFYRRVWSLNDRYKFYFLVSNCVPCSSSTIYWTVSDFSHWVKWLDGRIPDRK